MKPNKLLHHLPPIIIDVFVGFLCASTLLSLCVSILTLRSIPPVWVVLPVFILSTWLASRVRTRASGSLTARQRGLLLAACLALALAAMWRIPLRVPSIPQRHTLTIIAGDILTRSLEGEVVLRDLIIAGRSVPPEALHVRQGNADPAIRGGIKITQFSVFEVGFSGSRSTNVKGIFSSASSGGSVTLMIDGLRSAAITLPEMTVVNLQPDPSPLEASLEIAVRGITCAGLACILFGAGLFLLSFGKHIANRPEAAFGILIALAIALLFVHGVSLGMDRRLSIYDEQFSLPVAVSRLYYRIPGYAFFCDLAPFDETVLEQGRVPPAEWTVLCPAAKVDKGGADYATLSLRLFGLRPQALYYTWFLLFSASVLVFFLAYRRRPLALFLLLCLILSIYAVSFVYGFSPHLGSLADPRSMGLISAAALLHLTLASLDPPRRSLPQILALLVQAALVLFAVYCRFSIAYQIAAVVLLGAWTAFRAFRRTRTAPANEPDAERPSPLAHALPGLLLFAGACLVLLGQKVFLKDVVAADQYDHHPFWHNIGVGLGFHPDLAQKYGLTSDELTADRAMHRLVNRRLTAFRDLTEWVPSDRILYEDGARRTVFGILSAHPLEAAALYLYNKPRAFFKVILSVSPFVRHTEAYRRFEYNPLRPEIPLLLLPALLLLYWHAAGRGQRLPVRRSVLLALWLFACACLPWLIAYPMLHVVPEALVWFTFLVLSGVGWLVFREQAIFTGNEYV